MANQDAVNATRCQPIPIEGGFTRKNGYDRNHRDVAGYTPNAVLVDRLESFLRRARYLVFRFILPELVFRFFDQCLGNDEQ